MATSHAFSCTTALPVLRPVLRRHPPTQTTAIARPSCLSHLRSLTGPTTPGSRVREERALGGSGVGRDTIPSAREAPQGTLGTGKCAELCSHPSPAAAPGISGQRGNHLCSVPFPRPSCTWSGPPPTSARQPDLPSPTRGRRGGGGGARGRRRASPPPCSPCLQSPTPPPANSLRGEPCFCSPVGPKHRVPQPPHRPLRLVSSSLTAVVRTSLSSPGPAAHACRTH